MSRRYCFSLDILTSDSYHPSIPTYLFIFQLLGENWWNQLEIIIIHATFAEILHLDLAYMKIKAFPPKTTFQIVGYSHFVINLSLPQVSQRLREWEWETFLQIRHMLQYQDMKTLETPECAF